MKPIRPEVLPPLRHLFSLADGVTFLNCANMSPQLRAVTEVGIEAMRQKETPWKIAVADWFSGAEALRAAAADLMGADSEGIALVPAVSYGIAIAASAVPVLSGQNVVVLHEQFPSNFYAWRARAAAAGADLRTVRKEPADAWTDALLDAIDESTAVVAVPNCHWTDGSVVDLTAVGECTRRVGAALVVDASQSLGAYPLDVATLQPDFLVSVGYKWQLGPYGLGYLYVAPKWRQVGSPLEDSWLTRAGAEDFTGLVDYVDTYRSGARRFDMGEYPQFVLGPTALAAVSQLLEWGVERIQATLSRLTALLAGGVEELGCAVLPADRRVGHMLGVRFPAGIPETLPSRLAEERVFVSVRGDAIRVAPHVYNDEDDVHRLLAILGEFA